MVALLGVIALLVSQLPGDGWAMVDSRPREVRRLYWDLFQTTEVWVTLSPVTAAKITGPRFAFQAFFPGREVKGRPQRIQVKALAGEMANEPSLRVTIDGKTMDLTGPAGISFLLYPPGCEGCVANGVVADLKPEVLRNLVDAADAAIVAFGLTFHLSSEDRAALGEFAKQIGLGPAGEAGGRGASESTGRGQMASHHDPARKCRIGTMDDRRFHAEASESNAAPSVLTTFATGRWDLRVDRACDDRPG